MAELTGSDILELLNKVLEENQKSNKEMIKDLAFQISHPAPTEKELEKQKNMLAARIEAAEIEAKGKARKRQFCTGQSDKPHHRPNDPLMQGVMAGQSLVQWHLTQYSSRNDQGQLCLSQPIPVGICIWCHTEFKPGDEGYMEAIGWGMNTRISEAHMNRHNGDWVEMVESR